MRDLVVREGRCGALEWGVCSSPYPGQRCSGDACLVRETASGVLVAVVDGLGHGEEAHAVAERALASLEQTAGQPLVACLTACHAALRGTRGAAVTLVALEPEHRRRDWVAVGNVDATVVVGRGGESGAGRQHSVPLRGGVVGDRLPQIRQSTVPFAAGDVLVSATDGLTPAFADAIDVRVRPSAAARALHRRFARADDDALVLVVRRGEGAATTFGPRRPATAFGPRRPGSS